MFWLRHIKAYNNMIFGGQTNHFNYSTINREIVWK